MKNIKYKLVLCIPFIMSGCVGHKCVTGDKHKCTETVTVTKVSENPYVTHNGDAVVFLSTRTYNLR